MSEDKGKKNIKEKVKDRVDKYNSKFNSVEISKRKKNLVIMLVLSVVGLIALSFAVEKAANGIIDNQYNHKDYVNPFKLPSDKDILKTKDELFDLNDTLKAIEKKSNELFNINDTLQ
jgi:hypothetical protein